MQYLKQKERNRRLQVASKVPPRNFMDHDGGSGDAIKLQKTIGNHGMLRHLEYSVNLKEGEQIPVHEPVHAVEQNKQNESCLLREEADAGKAVPSTKALDPITELIALSPSTNPGYAGWLIKAAELGFAAFTDPRKEIENQLKSLAGDKKIGSIPKDAAVLPGLKTMYSIVKASIDRWTKDGASVEKKKPVALGSFIRNTVDRHGVGKAVDINELNFTSAAGVIQVLGDLPVGAYGIGLPFQGEFFQPSDELKSKKEAQQKNLAKQAPVGPETSSSKEDQNASKIPVEPDKITGAVVQWDSGEYESEYDPDTKKWKDKRVNSLGAVEHLKSDALKKKIKDMSTNGYALLIFPDAPNHLHIDSRITIFEKSF